MRVMVKIENGRESEKGGHRKGCEERYKISEWREFQKGKYMITRMVTQMAT
jgi:hypothetical protein